ncbi:MAG: hypothetical protein VB144_09605 [Clostridia bacterium]|nr:hypothetical protein [Clostridia bacterium]
MRHRCSCRRCGKNEITTLVIMGLMLAPIIRGSLASPLNQAGAGAHVGGI